MSRAGEDLILVHHVSHDVTTPYRASHAIYVRAKASEAEPFVDNGPRPVFEGRPLSLRGFDALGMLRAARLAAPGEADAGIPRPVRRRDIAYIHAHNAAHGCFCRADRPDLNDARHPVPIDEATASPFEARDKAMDGRFVIRGQNDRHLLQAELPGPAPPPRISRSSRMARRRGTRATGPACAASPTRSAATMEAIARAVALIEASESAPTLDGLANAVGYAPHHFQRLFTRRSASRRRLMRGNCAPPGSKERSARKDGSPMPYMMQAMRRRAAFMPMPRDGWA